MIKSETYEDMIKIFQNNKEKYDSFNSVSEVKEFLILNKQPMNFQFMQSSELTRFTRCNKIKFCY